MKIDGINWADRTPIVLLKLFSICVAVPLFVLCWLAFIRLTYCRFQDLGLSARMDLVAKILASSAPQGSEKVAAETILLEAKQGGRTGVKLSWKSSGLSLSNQISSVEEKLLDAEFIDAAAKVISLKEDDSTLIESYKKLAELGGKLSGTALYQRRLPGGLLTSRPSLSERMFKSYYIFEGVSFRTPSDFGEARKSAKLYIKQINTNFGEGQFNFVFWMRPWAALRFYDPKRALLNDMIPFLLAELILVAGFFLRYRYYDAEFEGTKGIHQRPAVKWIPLWEKPVAPVEWDSVRFGPHWLLWIGAIILVCEAIELIQNDPEIVAERWINIPMMGIVGACLGSAIPALLSILISRFSPSFRRRTSALKSRILRPLFIALWALIIICIFIVYFSYDQLILRGNSDMRDRGRIQIVFCILVILLSCASLIFFIRPVVHSHGDSSVSKVDDEGFNPPEPPWCMKLFTNRIDEKLIMSITSIIFPFKIILAVMNS